MPYKQKILQTLISNSNLVNIIDSTKASDPSKLIWTHIFPTHRVNKDLLGQEGVFITVDVFAPRRITNTYKEVIVAFNIFAHENKQKTDDGYCVVDYIQAEIDDMFNGKDGYGVGYLEFKQNNLLEVNEDYYGAVIVYSVTNFNNLVGI